MPTQSWPTLDAFAPRSRDGFAIGLSVPKSGFAAFYTGDTQTVSHAADRLRITLQLPPCPPAVAGLREAFVQGLISTGDWVRIGHMVRPLPLGTLRGTPSLAAATAAGVRSLVLTGATPGATLLGGDYLGAADQLLPVAYEGAVADGLGQMTVPLLRPLQRPLAAGQALQWQSPTGTFQLIAQEITFSYGPGRWQRAVTLPMREVFLT